MMQRARCDRGVGHALETTAVVLTIAIVVTALTAIGLPQQIRCALSGAVRQVIDDAAPAECSRGEIVQAGVTAAPGAPPESPNAPARPLVLSAGGSTPAPSGGPVVDLASLLTTRDRNSASTLVVGAGPQIYSEADLQRLLFRPGQPTATPTSAPSSPAPTPWLTAPQADVYVDGEASIRGGDPRIAEMARWQDDLADGLDDLLGSDAFADASGCLPAVLAARTGTSSNSGVFYETYNVVLLNVDRFSAATYFNYAHEVGHAISYCLNGAAYSTRNQQIVEEALAIYFGGTLAESVQAATSPYYTSPANFCSRLLESDVYDQGRPIVSLLVFLRARLVARYGTEAGNDYAMELLAQLYRSDGFDSLQDFHDGVRDGTALIGVPLSVADDAFDDLRWNDYLDGTCQAG